MKNIDWFNLITCPIWLPLGLLGVVIIKIAGIIWDMWRQEKRGW